MNLIFDTSHAFFKSYAVFKSRYVDVDLSTEESQQQLIRKFLTDFCFSMNTFKRMGIEQVVMCFDSENNFRKILDVEYKANRSKQEQGFYDTRDKIQQILTAKGFIVSRLDFFESDDLCGTWSKYFSINKKECIIFSSDKDIRQLANDYTIIYSNNSKLAEIYYTKPFDFFYSFKSSTKIAYNEVSPDFITLEKVLLGDKGDNVSRIAKRGVGHQKLVEIASICKKKGILNNYEEIYKLCNEIDIFENVSYERLILNKNLVDLQNPEYPLNLKRQILDHVVELKNTYSFSGDFTMQELYK